MTTRHVRKAFVASVLMFGIVALSPLTARAQGSAIPDEGGQITLVGCLTTGQIHDHERIVLAKPIVGSVASVPEASCSASGTDQIIKLQDLKEAGLGEAQLGQWIEIHGRLEGNHRADAIREVHVKSFSLVPVVIPRAAEVVTPPAAFEAPAPSAPIADAAPEPAPMPVPTTGERRTLPQTATTLPLFGLLSLVSFAIAFALYAICRRDVTSA